MMEFSDKSPIFSRRGFLTAAGATVLQAAVFQHATRGTAAAQNFRFGAYPFTLGIASGDPTPDGVVLWTRLAPDPLNGGGMPQVPVFVDWEIATDDRMRRVVRRGVATALPQLGHSVHVEVEGLQPERYYWYRFRVGSEASPIGRTRTAPYYRAALDKLTFAFVSCQSYSAGLYTAYRRLAEENLDFCVHLGDYIYEGADAGFIPERRHLPTHEIMTLDDYRIRLAQYKSDPALMAVHAAFPFIVTWDDHEVENNYAGFIPQDARDTPIFAQRRANAYQAYYEHMPLRREQLPRGPYLQLYRRLKFGNLAEINVLDTRQYRSHGQPANCDVNTRIGGYCEDALDPTRTIQGTAQANWLIDGLGRSLASWNILANQLRFAPQDSNNNPDIKTFGGETWDGYPLDRQKLLDFLAARRLTNTVIITGDVHQNIVWNVPPDHLHLDSLPVATEFMGTSISTGGERSLSAVYWGDVNNPHRVFQNNHHGYARCTLKPETFQVDYRVVPTVTALDAPVSTLASFVVEQGQAGANLLEQTPVAPGSGTLSGL